MDKEYNTIDLDGKPYALIFTGYKYTILCLRPRSKHSCLFYVLGKNKAAKNNI